MTFGAVDGVKEAVEDVPGTCNFFDCLPVVRDNNEGGITATVGQFDLFFGCFRHTKWVFDLLALLLALVPICMTVKQELQKKSSAIN